MEGRLVSGRLVSGGGESFGEGGEESSGSVSGVSAVVAGCEEKRGGLVGRCSRLVILDALDCASAFSLAALDCSSVRFSRS